MTTRPPPPAFPATPSRLHFDGTINIPTLIMLMAMVAGMISGGLGIYSSLSQRIDGNARDNALLKNQVDAVKADQVRDRADVRGDLHDINAKLDQLLWDRGDRLKDPKP